MSSVINPAEQPLEQPSREQIGEAERKVDEAQRKLDGLQANLRAVDAELAELAARREPYQLLGQICDSLEKLDGLDGSQLFWGGRMDAGEHLQQARARIGDFDAQIRGVEEKRIAVINEIKGGEDVLFILEDDLFERQLEEDRRRSEWLVEREVDEFPQHEQHLAWARAGEDDKRFRKSLTTAMLIAFLAGALLPLIKIPLPDLQQRMDLPERFARLIEREQPKPLPPPPAVVDEQPEQPKVEKPKPEEKQPEEKPVVANEPPPPAPKDEKPAPAPAPSARQRAEAAGILAFRESFSTLAVGRPAARLGSSARVTNSGEKSAGPPERSMITTQAPGSSGGINLASFSRDLGGDGDGDGGGGIEGVAITRVGSSIGSGPGGDGPRGNGVGNGNGRGAVAGRTDEEIQIVFDRYKSALYRLYNRELRNDPTLRGQMILKLTIEPDGSVSMCVLQSSDMNSPALAEQVVERVKAFSFGAKDVPAITIIYPIDFLPAA